MRRVFPAVLLTLQFACGGPESPSATPTSPASIATTSTPPTATASASLPAIVNPSATPVATAPAGDSADAPYRCDQDADCTVSCKWGALNGTWYRDKHLPECKDGCKRGADSVKCDAHVCTAFKRGGRVDDCTRVPVTELE